MIHEQRKRISALLAVQIPSRSAAITSFTMGNKTLQAAVLLMNSVMIDTRKRRENTAPNGARLPNGFML